MPGKRKYHPFFLRLFHWEYWPAAISNIPVVMFWLYYAVRARSLLFFTTVNPDILTSGLFGESKYEILQEIPESLRPTTLLIPSGHAGIAEVERKMLQAGIGFPCIAKPDVGERGRGVAKIDDIDSLGRYLSAFRDIDLIIQEYIDLPAEFSVLCYRIPGTEEAGITSICGKEFLKVRGNGSSTLEELIREKPRALLQYNRLQKVMGPRLKDTPRKGEEVSLEVIGNHCRGTKFLNRNDLIDPASTRVFNAFLASMRQVHYGRFDLRTQGDSNLATGNGIKVLEFNGVGSEPAHVYDPAYSIFRAYSDFRRHWKLLFLIGRAQRRAGHEPMTFRAFRRLWRSYRAHIRKLESGMQNMQYT